MEAPTYRAGSLAFTSTFHEPVYRLCREGHLLQQSLFHALRDFGLGARDMEESGALLGPGRWSLSASFLSYGASLRVRVDGIEVTFQGSPPADRVHVILRAVEGAVAGTLRGITMARRGLVYQGHVALPEGGYQAKVGVYWGTYPDGLGELAAQGVGLYFRSPLFSGEGSIVIDKSTAAPGGLFLQVRCEFDAGAYELERALVNFRRYLGSVGRAFALEGALGTYGENDD